MPIEIEVGRDGVWRRDGATVAVRARARTRRRRRGVPGTARPVRRGRHGSGPARVPRRPVRRRRGARLRALHGQGDVQGADGPGRPAPGRATGRSRRRDVRAERERVLGDLRPLGLPVFVKPARLGSSVGIVRVARRGGAAGGARDGVRARPLAIVEAAARGLEVECSVLGGERAHRLAARRDRARQRRGGLVRLRGQVHAGRDAADRSGAVARARARAGPGDRGRARSCGAGCYGLARVDFFVDGRAACCSTSSTRCPGSPARACTRRCSRPAGSRTRSCSTGSSSWRSSATRRSGATATNLRYDDRDRISRRRRSGIHGNRHRRGGRGGGDPGDRARRRRSRARRWRASGSRRRSARAVRGGKLDAAQAEAARERIDLTTRLEAIGEADLVIEAVPEDGS